MSVIHADDFIIFTDIQKMNLELQTVTIEWRWPFEWWPVNTIYTVHAFFCWEKFHNADWFQAELEVDSLISIMYKIMF